MKKIPLSNGLCAIVDDDDFEWLSKFKWHAWKKPGGTTYYARRSVPSGVVYMHREVCECGSGYMVDHKNRNGLDNRRFNLRPATPQQNAVNSGLRSDNKSGFKGVSYAVRHKKWLAKTSAKEDGKTIYYYIGLFDSPEEAHAAYLAKKAQIHGEGFLPGRS